MPFDDEIPPHDYAEPPAKLDQLARVVIGAAIEVHRELGAGHLEEAYERALAIEMRRRGIPFAQQVKMPLLYKGEKVSESRIDFLIDGQLVVEIKSCDSLASIHKAQVIAYLKMSSQSLALLINFNVPVLKEGIKRIIYQT
ncbi:MAG TPA: GxxExxY protein [Tepidisphaeraceae bacterium]|jgi:GxxExxY protein|nr:GxxExxY protein [Tepidisphaeraceae bacterium]